VSSVIAFRRSTKISAASTRRVLAVFRSSLSLELSSELIVRKDAQLSSGGLIRMSVYSEVTINNCRGYVSIQKISWTALGFGPGEIVVRRRTRRRPVS